MGSFDSLAAAAAAGAEIGRISERHWERYLRLMLRAPSADVNPQYIRLITGAAHPFANFALVVDPNDKVSAASAMTELVRREVPAAMMLVGRVGDKMSAILQQQGFMRHGAMTAMAIDIDRLPTIPCPDGCSFTRIGPGAACQFWAECFANGFEFPPIVGAMFSPEIIGPDPAIDARAQFFAVERNGQMVGTSMLYLEDGVAGLYCISTLPHARGQGLAAFCTVATLRHAQRRGYSVGVLQATEAGHPLYLRLGFHDVGEIPIFVRMLDHNA